MEFTLPKVSEDVITISPEAAQAVLGIMSEKELTNHALRIYVAGSGCSGIQYGMAIDDNINATDTEVEAEGLKIIIDHQSIEYTRGANIEYVNDPDRGTGFVITNPNAQGGGCGCGSGTGSHNHGDSGSCGSGGGCGCG